MSCFRCILANAFVKWVKEWIFRTAAILKYVSHLLFNYSPSTTLRFQKLKIPCLQLEINHTIERILQCYVSELEAIKKASIVYNKDRYFSTKVKTFWKYLPWLYCAEQLRSSPVTVRCLWGPFSVREGLTVCHREARLTSCALKNCLCVTAFMRASESPLSS